MGAEMHPTTPDDLEKAMWFRPSLVSEPGAEPAPPGRDLTVHLPRGLVLPEAQSRILEFAARFAGRVYGMVLHDHPDLASRPGPYLEAVRDLDRLLARIPQRPWLFIEYAAGLDVAVYRAFLESARDFQRIGACIDVGHIGIWRARQAFAKLHPDTDVCALKREPARVPGLMSEVQAAVDESLPAVLELIGGLGPLGKPTHFHLHDGHPLSTFSRYGVSDHLSFLTRIPLGFDYQGHRTAPLMFGPAGLSRIVRRALDTLGPNRASFTLEIHPPDGRLPLDSEAALLFRHWVDKTNAERMNLWMATLAENLQILRQSLSTPSGG